MRQRVQAHHVGGAERAAAGAAKFLAGEVVDDVVAQAKRLGLLDRRQHAGDADPVRDEVRRVERTHHAFAQIAGDKGFELVEDLGLRGRRGDQLHELHVARRVEEVDATEARFDFFRQHLRQLRDRQARGVARHDRVWCECRRDALVQVELPVQTLGDGFDHQVALAQLVEVFVVVGWLDQRRVFRDSQRRGLEFLQPVHRLGHDESLGGRRRGRSPVIGGGRQIEQHHRHLDVDQMRGDLRAHHTGAEHRDLAHLKSIHVHSTRNHVWVRKNGPM